MPMPQGGGADPSSAPPSPQGGGAVPSGGAAAGPETAGMLPPTGGAGAIDQSVAAQGLISMGMDIMRKAMGQIHFARVLLDPYSEEGKAADTMFRHGIKHFKPDSDTSKTGKTPQMAGPQPQGQGSPQMAPPPAQPPTGPIPSMAGGNV
jgi:hypothetical protein